jgi:RsiW-degrading membrane proteinase PrsW (M82 family)
VGLIPSFFGFVFGVGLCEELVKAIPIVIYLKSAEYSRWRVAMLVGLASGIGFGVSEGIMYSGDMYNGLVGPSIYLVRFLSCVALHSIWAGSVGVLMHHDQETLFDDFNLVSAGMFIVKYLSVAMVLHGLYDVLLKQQLPWAALLVALASFGWLAFLVRRSEGTEWSTAMRTA